MTWMRLPEEYCGSESKFCILPVAYEKDATFGAGASKGPQAIISASEHLEYYDEQFNIEAFVNGIITLESVTADTPQEMIANIAAVYPRDKFCIGFGGDHACTLGFVRALEATHDDFSVLILDAHSDFRDSWNNSNLNHACVSKVISGKHSLGLVGVRSQDVDEAKAIANRDDVHMIKAYDFSVGSFRDMLSKLKDKVYVSIDVDVFGPSFIRNTGTPEPGGLSWDVVVGILQEVFSQKDVIGADIVEFAPVENYAAESYALAKLAYKLMGLKSLSQK